MDRVVATDCALGYFRPHHNFRDALRSTRRPAASSFTRPLDWGAFTERANLAIAGLWLHPALASEALRNRALDFSNWGWVKNKAPSGYRTCSRQWHFVHSVIRFSSASSPP